MAINKGNSKLSVFLYAIILIEFIAIVALSPGGKSSCPVKIEESIPNLVESLSNSLTVSALQKVLVYPVDANDGSGVVKGKTGDMEETLYLTVPNTSDPNFINTIKKSIRVIRVKMEKTSGKKAQGVPPPDQEIKQAADNANEISNDILSFDKNNIAAKTDPNTKTSYIQIPLVFKIRQTGYYRIDIELKPNRINFGNANGFETIDVDNSKLCIDYSNNPKINKNLLTQKMNNFSTSIYIAVTDGTQPSETIPKKPIEVEIQRGR